MQVIYNEKNDLLYIRFDQKKQPVVNQLMNEDIVIDRGENDRIIGIEILDASQNINLISLFPCEYQGITKVV